MVMGTSSSAGKSLITAALCRCFARRGYRVAPFKAQNMSNNAAVCADGGEIGRSQALQAMAARTIPTTDMNPILLKPEGNTHSQVIVNGRPYQSHPDNTRRGSSIEAADYFRRRHELWPHVTSAIERLRSQFDLVVIEGAGSPAELNLRSAELVNMAVAKHCQSAVILVGDIERGGVFAQLLGTLWLLEPNERSLIQGLIVNKFRGDLRLFDSGVEILEERGGVPVLGVLPWVEQLGLPEEDAVALLDWMSAAPAKDIEATIDVAVIHLPHIANFDDFDPLAYDPRVQLRYVRQVDQLGTPRAVILPGTKNTQADLAWLRQTGLADALLRLRADTHTQIVGICGGYQMLGRTIRNASHLERNDVVNAEDISQGLGLLDCHTVFEHDKQTCQVQSIVSPNSPIPGTQGLRLDGYEIHVGQTTSSSSWLLRQSAQGHQQCNNALDGAFDETGQVWGCYLHGLFGNDSFRNAWLVSLGAVPQSSDETTVSDEQRIHRALDRLADIFEEHVSMRTIEQMIAQQSLGEHLLTTSTTGNQDYD
jgi:adenosylcobyric acid synthase